MKLLLFLVTATSIIFSPIAHAQNPEGATTVQEGEPAPFSGTLLTNEAAATLLAEIQVCSERSALDYELELERQKSTCKSPIPFFRRPKNQLQSEKLVVQITFGSQSVANSVWIA